MMMHKTRRSKLITKFLQLCVKTGEDHVASLRHDSVIVWLLHASGPSIEICLLGNSHDDRRSTDLVANLPLTGTLQITALKLSGSRHWCLLNTPE